MNKNPLSNCCKAPMTADCGSEGTCCYICTACKKACDMESGKVDVIGHVGGARSIKLTKKEKEHIDQENEKTMGQFNKDCKHEIEQIRSGGSDVYPLPVCKKCGWIVVSNKNIGVSNKLEANDVKLSCLSIECPERKSVCCGATSYMNNTVAIKMGKPMFACYKCGKEFVGGECTTEKKVKEWFDDCDWRKELKKEFKCRDCDGGGTIANKIGEDEWEPQQCQYCYQYVFPVMEFIETLLIKILAKCETVGTAREARHILKEYLLKEK